MTSSNALQSPTGTSSRDSPMYARSDDSASLDAKLYDKKFRLKPHRTSLATSHFQRGGLPDQPQVGASMKTRRRVHSVELPPMSDPSYQTDPSSSSQRGPRRHRAVGRIQDSATFTDEYDLSQEDPMILRDVQRALTLKSKREARMKQSAPLPDALVLSPMIINPQHTLSPFLPPITQKEIASADVDFSPSVSGSSLHPVPASLDNGLTLDWSGYSFNDRAGSRWKVSPAKKREKEASPPLNLILERQTKAYCDKITQLKTMLSPHTIRKAKLTSQQLQRRYALVYGGLSSGTPLNIAKAARWYGSQEPIVKTSLRKSEPSTWLKHLEKGNKEIPGSTPWYLSALIVEEYLRSDLQREVPKGVAEDSVSDGFNVFSQISRFPRMPSTSSPSLEQLSPTKQVSIEGAGVSFEPLKHAPSYLKRENDESPYNSPYSGSLSLSGFQDISPSYKSDKASRQRRPTMSASPSSSEVASLPQERARTQKEHVGTKSWAAETTAENMTFEPQDQGASEVGSAHETGLLGPQDVQISHAPLSRSSTLISHPIAHRVFEHRRRVRSYLPSSITSRSSSQERSWEALDENVHAHKIRLLDQSIACNHRIRQLLNRVSTDIKDYESSQSTSVTTILGMPYKRLPKEVIEAFGHDPAAVTGATRRYRGWRAVEDIDHRLVRQRQTLQDFLLDKLQEESPLCGVLDEPIESLLEMLEKLERDATDISEKAIEVEDALSKVQALQADVKKDYNRTLSETSLVYPELSYLVALEESYKDQYQQFWEFGMDTLTFLLDTVTPFWRNYGKLIGEDIRDFLIIPLYRNEFTGESKRYPITSLPRRSLRHWLGLVLFFISCLVVNILQARAAVSSTAYYRLPMIPYEGIRWTALPFFWVGIMIQWWAVVVEIFVVLLQIGVLMWWIGWSLSIYN